jgi:hypothetical protein
VPTPPAPSPATTCMKGRRGPKCSSDDDCNNLHGCVRCAHSGFCTDQPLPWIAPQTVAIVQSETMLV